MGDARHSHKPMGEERLTPAEAAQRFQDRTGIATVALFVETPGAYPQEAFDNNPPQRSADVAPSDPEFQIRVLRWAMVEHHFMHEADFHWKEARSPYQRKIDRRVRRSIRAAAASLRAICDLAPNPKPDDQGRRVPPPDGWFELSQVLERGVADAGYFKAEPRDRKLELTMHRIRTIEWILRHGEVALGAANPFTGPRKPARRGRPPCDAFPGFVVNCRRIVVAGRPIGPDRIAWLCIANDVGADDKRTDGSYSVERMALRVRQVLRRKAPADTGNPPPPETEST